MKEFIKKHEANVLGSLSGWDRMRFRGTTRLLCCVPGLMAWLTDRRIRLTEFRQFALDLTAQLKASVEQMASAAGRSIQYLASSALSKEDLVQELLRREGISEGLVCVLSCVEPCRSFDIRKDRDTGHIEPVPELRKCLHWYFYFIDSALGLCHVRIQSWLPFAVHICVNGREWLCRELSRAGIGFQRRDNCLVDVEDFEVAQKFLDAQPWANWQRILNNLLRRSCPILLKLPFRGDWLRYYWSAEATELATDILFRSPQALADLYPSLLRHAMTTFGSADVLRFLGRRLSPEQGVAGWFRGEVTSDLKTRPEGVRIKHRVNTNSIKMYDKQGSVLRVETTINNARDMKVFRASETNPRGPKSWRILRKAVVDLPRRAQISQAANARYLAALSAVDAQTPLGQIADALSTATVSKGRRVRGLNPILGADARLAALLLRGEFTINGFRNRDLRQELFPDAQTPEELRRASAKVTRLLGLFRAHGLIRKLASTHRYQLTPYGRRSLPAFVAARHTSTEKLNQMAA